MWQQADGTTSPAEGRPAGPALRAPGAPDGAGIRPVLFACPDPSEPHPADPLSGMELFQHARLELQRGLDPADPLAAAALAALEAAEHLLAAAAPGTKDDALEHARDAVAAARATSLAARFALVRLTDIARAE